MRRNKSKIIKKQSIYIETEEQLNKYRAGNKLILPYAYVSIGIPVISTGLCIEQKEGSEVLFKKEVLVNSIDIQSSIHSWGNITVLDSIRSDGLINCGGVLIVGGNIDIENVIRAKKIVVNGDCKCLQIQSDVVSINGRLVLTYVWCINIGKEHAKAIECKWYDPADDYTIENWNKGLQKAGVYWNYEKKGE